MTAQGWILVALGVANIPVYIGLGKLLFDDMDGFLDAVRFCFTPRLISFFRGEYWEDYFAGVKMSVLIGASSAIVAAEYALIVHFFF